MSRFIGLATLALVVAGSSPAFATQARIDSMGGASRYWTVEDELNIFDFPSLLVRYGNHAYVDNLSAVGLAGTRFGFHYSLSDTMVLAVYGGQVGTNSRNVDGTAPGGTNASVFYETGFTPAGNAFTGGHSLGVGLEASATPQAGGGNANGRASALTGQNAFIGGVQLKMGILWAMELGATTRLGVMLNILGDDGDIEQPDGAKTDQGALLIDLAAGLGLDFVGSSLELALGVEFGLSDDFRDGVNAVSGNQSSLNQHFSSSHLAIRLGGRFTVDLTDRQKLVTYAQVLYGSQEVSNQNLPVGVSEAGSWNGLAFVLGADLRMELFEDVFVVPGLGMRYAQNSVEGVDQTTEDADRLISLPYYGVGVDVKIWDWLDFRFGANQYVNFYRKSNTNAEVADATIERRESDVQTTVATGLGFHFPVAESLLTIDLQVNPLFWLNGPDFVTGTPSAPARTDGDAANVAIKYQW